MILAVEDIQVSYAKKRVLHGVSLGIGSQEVVALIGHNGAGKTTLLKAILGLLRVEAGRVSFLGQEITNRPPHHNVRQGIRYCPQGGGVFPRLSVVENLEVAGSAFGDGSQVRERIGRVFDLFPALLGRRDFKAGVLSGGERQMLAIGMSLMLSPRLFLIDEPSGGLAPRYIDRVFESIATINQAFQTAILLVEQNIQHALKIAHQVYVMRNGRIVYHGPAQEAKEVVADKFFGFTQEGAQTPSLK